MIRAKDIGLLALALALVAAPALIGAAFGGVVWGVLAALAVAAALTWLASRLGISGGFDVLLIGNGVNLLGLLAGLIWGWLA